MDAEPTHGPLVHAERYVRDRRFKKRIERGPPVLHLEAKIRNVVEPHFTAGDLRLTRDIRIGIAEYVDQKFLSGKLHLRDQRPVRRRDGLVDKGIDIRQLLKTGRNAERRHDRLLRKGR